MSIERQGPTESNSSIQPVSPPKGGSSDAPPDSDLYELMDRYIDGDPQAFTRLHSKLTPRLRPFLLKLIRNQAAVEDLLQLTFMKAHLARQRFELRGGADPNGAVRGWYFAIARNLAMDHLRQRSRADRNERAAAKEWPDGVGIETNGGASLEDAAAESERDQEIVEQVRGALEQLPNGQREVVELHKLRGMSMAQVAQRLNIGEGAARVRAHRGYKALARILGANATLALLVSECFHLSLYAVLWIVAVGESTGYIGGLR